MSSSSDLRINEISRIRYRFFVDIRLLHAALTRVNTESNCRVPAIRAYRTYGIMYDTGVPKTDVSVKTAVNYRTKPGGTIERSTANNNRAEHEIINPNRR